MSFAKFNLHKTIYNESKVVNWRLNKNFNKKFNVKKILLLFSLLCLFKTAHAQLSDGATAPDWTLVDLDGNSHHLYEYLDSGYTVYLDFFATWCGPCWAYHSSHAFEDLYSEYGPSGTNEVRCFGIEADYSTSEDCMYDINCPSSQGDWTAGVDFPQVNLTGSNGPNVANDYQINYYPTIYAICPNKQIWEVGQRNKQGLYNFISTCPQPPPLAFQYTDTDIHCSLNPTGSINLTVSGGQLPYSYLWSNGATTEDLQNLYPGTYTVTITDGESSQLVSDPIVITGPTSLVETELLNTVTATCDIPNGSATVSVSGGDPGYTYLWSNNTTDQNLTNVNGGNYSFTVTDAEGCTATLTAEVPAIPPPTVVISQNGPALDCDNRQTTLTSSGSSSGPDFTYLWTTDGGNILSDPTAAEITVDQGGIYILTIHDNPNDCYNSSFFTVDGLNGAPEAEAGPDKSMACSGGQVTLDGDGSSEGSNYNYSWTTIDGHIISDPSQLTIQVDQIGTYVLAVSNEFNNCTSTDTVKVNSTGNVTYTSDVNNIACHGENDGSITLSGTNLTFFWSIGSTDGELADLAAGTYTVTVTSPAGCEKTQAFDVTQPDALVLNLVGTDETGNDTNDGTVSVTVGGGVADYTYLWSNGSTESSQSGLEPGKYTVTVTDANGCTGVKSYIVNEFGCTLKVDGEVLNVKCNGGADGAIDLDIKDPQGTFTIEWSNGMTAEQISGLAAGTYTAVVTDSTGCQIETSYEVTQPAALNVSASTINPTCQDDKDGSIDIAADGGQGTLTYTWNNGATGPKIESLGVGSYTLTITDENGCNTIVDVVLATPNPITVDTAIVKEDDNGKGSIDITLSNEWPGTLKYQWKKDGADFSNNLDLTGLDKGVYELYVTTEGGCLFGPFTYDLSKLSVDKNYSNLINVYPNPADQVVYIDNIGQGNQFDVKIVNQLGKVVQHTTTTSKDNSIKLTLNKISSGAYYLFLDNGKKVAVKRLMIFRN